MVLYVNHSLAQGGMYPLDIGEQTGADPRVQGHTPGHSTAELQWELEVVFGSASHAALCR